MLRWKRPTKYAEPKDWAEHERTYKGFVTGVFLFAGHVLVVLLILAWVFSGSFGAQAFTG